MRFFQFLRHETSESWSTVLVMTLVAGVANGTILALINAGAADASSEQASLWIFVLFALAIATFVVSKRYALSHTLIYVESMVRKLRVRILDKIRRSELPLIENLGKGHLYTTVAQDANIISQSAFLIVNAAQEGIMLIFAFLYIGWLSAITALVLLVAMAGGLTFYYFHRRTFSERLQALAKKDAEFVDSIGHIIDGFKEAKLNRKKNEALFRSFRGIARDAEDLRVAMGTGFVTDVMFSHVFFYTLIGLIVFVMPRLVPTFNEVVMKMTAAVLFIVAPLEMIVNAMPMFSRSNVALENLYALEAGLDELRPEREPEDGAPSPDFSSFERIELRGGMYTYDEDDASFTVGPIDLDIVRGETLFIVGGNGSGKSTLLKLLTGLYPLTSGTMSVDGVPLDRDNIGAYRELISAIFTDFHLFDRLYGLEDVDDAAVEREIAEMELAEKTRYRGGRFTTTHLSTGQRKRLALIAALLENRAIYVFDEWAADQDQHFRNYFYNTVLGRLKKEGKTVIAVTHDDRYWGVADRTMKMETGKMVGQWQPRDE